MRIAFFSQYFYPEQFSNNAIVKELVERRHTVDVVCNVPNYGRDFFFTGYSNSQNRQETWEGASVFRARTIARGTSKIRLVANFLFYPLAGTFTALRHIKGRPDVSFVSMPSPIFQAVPALVLRALRGTPVVYWVQDLWPESATVTLGIRNRIVVEIMTAVCAWLYRRADVVMVQSEAFREKMNSHGVEPDRIVHLPNTAPNIFQPLDPESVPKQSALVPGGEFRLMFAGNIGESQDFETLIAAANLLRDCSDLVWIILGAGRGAAQAKLKVNELGLDDKFHFLGSHPSDEMPAFFSQADAMLVSLKDTEIFSLTVPYKVQCYMACGKPIVASIGGEAARIINLANAGVTVNASSPLELSKAILECVRMPKKEVAQLGANARQYFEVNYEQSIVYDRLEACLLSAAGKNKAI